ncbi:ABC transporter ATP-binding protein [Clostridium mediterraneense]|uniref:ABC transporter ATP-binding protein n=1 Tax=Clostridium mediterraneense TaxID=1805472 RepID=UPI00082D5013|nr:ABC transporter ATP-binding protein [Clostridium mediterraneense]
MSFYQKKIILDNIEKSFDGLKVLDKISLEIKQGDFISIVGSSGCGKSTIFNIICDLVQADKGTKEINGDIAYMYQKDMMVPWKKVIDNIGLPLVFKGVSKKDARIEVEKYLELFGLKGYENKFPNMLSGGMKQRANFLKTYLTSNDIILLDEPFGALDSITRRDMQIWLKDISKGIGATIIMITHDIEEAVLLSDKIYVLSNKPAKIVGEVGVSFSKERNREIIIDDNFIEFKKKVLGFMS